MEKQGFTSKSDRGEKVEEKVGAVAAIRAFFERTAATFVGVNVGRKTFVESIVGDSIWVFQVASQPTQLNDVFVVQPPQHVCAMEWPG